MLFFFNDTATTALYTYCHTLSLHDALPIWLDRHCRGVAKPGRIGPMRASSGVHLPDHRAIGFGGHSALGDVAVGPDADIEHPSVRAGGGEIGRAHVLTPVTNAHLVCRLLLEKKTTRMNTTYHTDTKRRETIKKMNK